MQIVSVKDKNSKCGCMVCVVEWPYQRNTVRCNTFVFTTLIRYRSWVLTHLLHEVHRFY